MKGTKLKYFLGLVILVCAYAVYDFKSEKSEAEAKAKNSVLVQQQADQIQTVRIQSPNVTIELQRQAEGWMILQPLQEKADSEAVTQFVEGIVTEKSQAVLPASGELKVYGLDAPRAKIIVKNNLNEETEISVSAKKNFQGDSYVLRKGSPEVFVASATWFQKAEKTVDDFRDRRWAQVEAGRIDLIEIEKGKDRVRLEKKDGRWISSSHPEWKLDQNKIRKHIASLTSNRIHSFSIRPDSKPLLGIKLFAEKNLLWAGELGSNKDKKHFLSRDSGKQTVEVVSTDAAEIYKISEDSVRDRSEPFQFKPEDVRKIEFQTADGKLSVLDLESLKAAVRKLVSSELLEFTPHSASGFPKSADRLILKDINDQVVFEVAWLRPEHRQVSGLEQLTYKMKTNLYPNIFYASEELVKELKWNERKTEKQGGK